jgi:hypothetical protein
MKPEQEFERLFHQEFRDIMPNTIWKNDDGVYSVFGHYQIVPEKVGYRVFCAATDVGLFGATRTALSWCIADKYKAYNLARELLTIDNKLQSLTQDIATRANLADRSKKFEFRDTIGMKLETKIIRKKQLENQLTKCVSWAKYCQQRGFNNETARTSRNTPNKAGR